MKHYHRLVGAKIIGTGALNGSLREWNCLATGRATVTENGPSITVRDGKQFRTLRIWTFTGTIQGGDFRAQFVNGQRVSLK